MFSFLLGLLGLGCLGLKCADEKAVAKQHDAYRRQYDEANYRYLRLNPSVELKNEIINKVYSGNYFDKICNELEEELSFVFGNNFRDTIAIAPYRYRNQYEQQNAIISEVVVRLLLAKLGKASRWDLMSGIYIQSKHIPYCGEVNGYEASIKAAQCFEKLLHDAGEIDITMVVKGDLSRHNRDGTLTDKAILNGWTDDIKWTGCKIIESRSTPSERAFRIW